MIDLIVFIPELLTLTIAILLIIYGAANIKISPPPDNITTITSEIDKTYCIPVTKLGNTSEETSIKKAATDAYRLMVVSLLSGCVLFLLAIYMIYEKATGHSFIPKKFSPNRF